MNLDELKRQIQNIHGGISLKPTMEDYRRVGELLLRAKRDCPKNQWGEWLRSIGSPKVRMCQYYMALARDENATHCVSIQEASRAWRDAKVAARKEIREQAIADALEAMPEIDDNCQIHHADCREFDWPEFDHCWSDPPWKELEYYRWLADLCRQKLKPGDCWLSNAFKTSCTRSCQSFVKT